MSTAHRHSGCPGLVDLGKAGPGKGKLGVKLPPISWDPGRGAGPLCTSVFLPEKWGNEICNLRSLWGPHCMSVTEEADVDLVRGSLRGHVQMSMGH